MNLIIDNLSLFFHLTTLYGSVNKLRRSASSFVTCKIVKIERQNVYNTTMIIED